MNARRRPTTSRCPSTCEAAIAADWDPAPPMPHPARPDVAPVHRAAAAPRCRARSPAAARRRRPAARRCAPTTPTTRSAPTAAFTWLTGETVADAVLVMTPSGDGARGDAVRRASTPSPARSRYFTSRTHGAVWVGNVPERRRHRRRARHRDPPARRLPRPRAIATTVAACSGLDAASTRCCRGATARGSAGRSTSCAWSRTSWEIDRLRHACDVTARGFADVVARAAARHRPRRTLRGERWLEGTFWRRARLEGNEVGYTSIVGAGRARDDAALVAQPRRDRAGQPAARRHGRRDRRALHRRRHPHDAGRRRVDARRSCRSTARCRRRRRPASPRSRPAPTSSPRTAPRCGCSPITCTRGASCRCRPRSPATDDPERPGAGLHRRYTLHGTSHMLGIDVHDCAQRAQRDLPRRHARRRARADRRARACTSSPTTAPCRPSCAASACASRTTSWSPTASRSTCPPMLPRDPDEIIAWMREVQAHRPADRDREPTSCCARRRGLPRRVCVDPGRRAVERFSRSSGPGGQSVNTTDSRVELRWDVARLGRARPTRSAPGCSTALAGRLVDGVLTHRASEHRSQLQNRTAARARLAALLRDALEPPVARPAGPTRPSRAAKQRRVDAKRRRGELKATRRRPPPRLIGTSVGTALDREPVRRAPRTAATRSASASTCSHTAGGSGANASTVRVSFLPDALVPPRAGDLAVDEHHAGTAEHRPQRLVHGLVRDDQVAVARLQVRVERAEQPHQLGAGGDASASTWSARAATPSRRRRPPRRGRPARLVRRRRGARRGSRRPRPAVAGPSSVR